MKIKICAFALLILFGLSCQKSDKATEPAALENSPTDRACGSYQLLQSALAVDPALRDRMNAIEGFTARAISSGAAQKVNARGEIVIPVVVHVVYNKPAENISDAQIASQIDVLNEDFNLQNRDHRLVPDHFRDLKADVGIRFTLDRVIRVKTERHQWAVGYGEDNIKLSSRGGSDAIDPTNYLNIWVGNLGGGLLGYATFPGWPIATDGVVVLYSAFGRTGTLIRNYNKGRTATHEIGHWLNLRHIWGDATCGNDGVGDTPLHNTYNTGCPSADHRSTCTGTPLEMWMNYMDYTYDACMYMFSEGQKNRMLSTLVPGGSRASFVD
jgi:hypothetical protein